jgi:hypothetical protein
MIELEEQNVDDIWLKFDKKYRTMFTTEISTPLSTQFDEEVWQNIVDELSEDFFCEEMK